ncbi:hypothetical protein H6G97_27890 [Nostoc flagelliforme FACHB-838]|uniref:Uncharacterized protein n=1 Tax=Nostoc flagelliforme FACHB-838 TaxID=2692904 RepID=A0ABR8DWC9_9NOSO|nr:hypothetical protein [Nostoc flagelliforme]MBD2533187.1 hypothetical protein [Nostoc flagelliforme FACHB-838]
MQIRLAPPVASKVEGIRLSLGYSKLSETVNLLMDAIRHQWSLNLTYLSQGVTTDARVRLDKRHLVWLSQYGAERGINIASVTNLLISEYLAGNTVSLSPHKPDTVISKSSPVQETQKQEITEPKLKGQQLIRGLKL